MRKSHRDAAADLQLEASKYGWKTMCEGTNGIRLTKEMNNNIFSVLLIRNGEGYDIQPFTYEFKSRISFFDYQIPENRYMRNKVAFMLFFNLLKRANMWDIISNRDTFLRVNKDCKRVNRQLGEVKASLHQMVSQFDIVRERKHKTVTGKRPKMRLYEHRKVRRFAA